MANNNRKAKLFFDGGTFPLNPGHGGCGAVIEVNKEDHSFWEYLGENVTNNQAEYRGLILGLEKALDMGIKHLNVYGDSKLVINQVTGEYGCYNEGLIPLQQKAYELSQQFEVCQLQWIPREKNSKADEAATMAIKSVVSESVIEIRDDLPLCEPRQGLEPKINRLNAQGDGAKFKEWLQLKSGRDKFSYLKGDRLNDAVPTEVREAIALALTEDEQDLLDKCLRWYLRGLKPIYAIKKARVDAEISANFAKKKG